MIMYRLEGIKDSNAVSKIFEKYCPFGVSRTGGDIFISSDSMPDCFKLIGFASLQNTAKLEQIAGIIADVDYEKKADKFQRKCNKMHQKVVIAKRATQQDEQISAGAFSSVSSISELIGKVEQQETAQAAPKVAKAQEKLDKHIAKNQLLSEAKRYATTSKSSPPITHDWVNAGKDIQTSIREAKRPKAEVIDSALKALKEFLDELLNVTAKVSIMHITDGSKAPTANLRTEVKINDLLADQLIETKNREMIIISK